MTGAFIVFEGGDGVGKSTQVRLLVDWLRAQGREVVPTFEPGATVVGAAIRSILLSKESGEFSPRAEALLYAADKASHVAEVVRPAMSRDAVVVCDRYLDSMIAYQGAGRVLEIAEVEAIANWATGALLPGLTILLDLDPAEAMAAITDKDRLESAGADFHLRVRQHFLELAARDPQRYLVLPARLPITELAATIQRRVAALLAGEQQNVGGS
ncbi:MAG: dTMP kinase [Propionibacteriaceae bacterium]|nr:dTMP kinase [Propionibacteriaceae bacterium]